MSNKVYAVGGYDRGHCLTLVECYDQEKNEWVPITSLTCPRGRLGLSCIDGKLSGGRVCSVLVCKHPWLEISTVL